MSDNQYGKMLPLKDRVFYWTRELTLSANYQLDGTPLNGERPLPDRGRLTLDGRWP